MNDTAAARVRQAAFEREKVRRHLAHNQVNPEVRRARAERLLLAVGGLEGTGKLTREHRAECLDLIARLKREHSERQAAEAAALLDAAKAASAPATAEAQP